MRTFKTLLISLCLLPLSGHALYQSSFLFCIIPDGTTTEAISGKLPIPNPMKDQEAQLGQKSEDAPIASTLLKANIETPDLDVNFGTFDEDSFLNIDSQNNELEDLSSLSTLSLDQE